MEVCAAVVQLGSKDAILVQLPWLYSWPQGGCAWPQSAEEAGQRLPPS